MLVLKNGKVFTQGKLIESDVGIEGGKISLIKKGLKGEEEISCSGKIILPGMIDSHVHFRVPGYEEKEDWVTGSHAALNGGITTVFDMPNNDPPTTTNVTLERKRAIIMEKTLVNFGLFFGASMESIKEFPLVKNVPGLKLYMADSTGKMGVPMSAHSKIFSEAQKNHMLLAVHAEDPEALKHNWEKAKAEKMDDPIIHSIIRNNEVELKAVQTAIDLQKKTDCRLHFCHISTQEAAKILKENTNIKISSEVAPHHLFLSAKDQKNLLNFAKVNPALKYEKDRAYLWEALRQGWIDIIASDHAPHTFEEKSADYWNAPAGIPGIETMLPLMLDAVNGGFIELNTVVKAMSESPAIKFGMENKGKIETGYDADLTIVDMKKEWTIDAAKLFTKANWSPFNGWKIKGKVSKTVVGGILKFDEGNIINSTTAKEATFKGLI